MIRVTTYLLIYVLMLILLGLYSNNAIADMYDMYYEEKVTYIIAYDRPLPEKTTFSCIDGKLKKGYHPVRNLNGANVGCWLKNMTRRDYESIASIPRTF